MIAHQINDSLIWHYQTYGHLFLAVAVIKCCFYIKSLYMMFQNSDHFNETVVVCFSGLCYYLFLSYITHLQYFLHVTHWIELPHMWILTLYRSSRQMVTTETFTKQNSPCSDNPLCSFQPFSYTDDIGVFIKRHVLEIVCSLVPVKNENHASFIDRVDRQCANFVLSMVHWLRSGIRVVFFNCLLKCNYMF